MSSTGLTLPSNYSPKPIWQRPEGFAAKVLVGIAAIGGLAALYFALPFLLSIVWGTINLIFGLAVLGVFGWAVFNPTLRNIVKNIFASAARKAAWLYTTVDPIGILQNHLDTMRKTAMDLKSNILKFSGTVNKLQDKIKKDKDDFINFMTKKQELESYASKETDKLKQQGYLLRANGNKQKADVLRGAIDQLEGLNKTTTDMLGAFKRWSQVIDVQVDTTGYQVDFLKDQREVVKATQANIGLGQKILHGEPAEVQQFNMAVEYLTDEATRTTGEAKEFNECMQDMLDNINLEGSINSPALQKKFEELSGKLPNDFQLTDGGTVANVIPDASVQAVNTNSYESLFRK